MVIRIEGMKNRQPAFKSLHKVAILAAYRHDIAFLVTILYASTTNTLTSSPTWAQLLAPH